MVPYPDIRIKAEPQEEDDSLIDKYKDTKLDEDQPPIEIDFVEPGETAG